MGLAVKPQDFVFIEDQEENGSEFGYTKPPVNQFARVISNLIALASFVALFALVLVGGDRDALFPEINASVDELEVAAQNASLSFFHISVVAALGLGVAFFAWLVRHEHRAWVRLSGVLTILCCALLWVDSTWGVVFSSLDSIPIEAPILLQLACGFSLVLCYGFSRECHESEGIVGASRSSPLMEAAILLLIATLFEMVIGTVMRVSGASMVSLGENGSWWQGIFPFVGEQALSNINQHRTELGLTSINQSQMFIHGFHRLSGLVVMIGAIVLWLTAILSPWKAGSRSRAGLLGVVTFAILQAITGFLSVHLLMDTALIGCHLVLGALFVGTLMIAIIRLARNL